MKNLFLFKKNPSSSSCQKYPEGKNSFFRRPLNPISPAPHCSVTLCYATVYFIFLFGVLYYNFPLQFKGLILCKNQLLSF